MFNIMFSKLIIMPEEYSVSILDCGGTISMIEEKGIRDMGGTPLDFEKIVHHSKWTQDVRLKVDERVLVQDSSDAKPENYLYIGGKIIEKLKGADHPDGIVVSHGTDTASSTVIALSFLLKKLPVPVVVTGCQIPPRNPDKSLNYASDAFPNLADSVNVSSKSGIAECCLVFNHKIYGPENLVKKDAWDVDAFTNVVRREMGRVKDDEIEIFDSSTTRNSNKDFFLDENFDPYRVGSVKITPSITPAVFNSIIDHYDAFVVESFGGGNIPKRLITGAIEPAVNRGKFIVNCSQPDGIVDMSSGYGLGRDFLNAGKREGDNTPLYVITGGDWTSLYAETRMAYVIGHRNEIKATASRFGLEPTQLIHAVYVSGARFRHQASKDAYREITGVAPYPKNILHNNDFKEVVRTIAEYQRTSIYLAARSVDAPKTRGASPKKKVVS